MCVLSRGPRVGRPGTDVSPRFRAALAQLIEAHDYARDTGRNPWDFAVEIRSLLGAGLTTSDLRCLVCKGYVEHAREVAPPGDDGRGFQPSGRLTFSRQTCFVLTETGVTLARTVHGHAALFLDLPASAGNHDGDSPAGPLLPRWDGELRELRLGGKLLKGYKLPAPNQEAILAAFEEEGWPPRVDDPLPPQPEQDPKRRLHDTLKALNRHQKHQLIRFLGDGTGEGVRWELIEGGPSGNSQGSQGRILTGR
jgi:hypothetical protein